ncbi:zinc finger protein RFP-like [Heteronotia binoei]|uniref:zinc finger protein RFP-like n=1 Tax=Heteronotia binoei TaxID=13085 RepID=UPI002931CC4D|nr:zinc finger protein RFP-like [Heteronotia binoei]
MATGGPVQELSEELTCPICREYFKDPVILTECDHSFCRACLTRSWGEAAVKVSCPVCKQTVQPRHLPANRQLAKFVEIAKKINLQRGEAEERICEKHREPLKLFCQTDEILVCMVCDRSKEHKDHEKIPAEEAAQEYKDKIFNCLKTLRTEKDKILVYLADAENESQEMLKIMESERQKTVAEFRTLHQVLEEQENRLLAQIEEVEREVARKRDDHLAKLSEELSSLESLIREMEGKHQQPQSEILQDVKSSLQRYKEKEIFKNPVAFSSDLKIRLQGCCGIGSFLGSIMKECKDTLVSELRMQKANVTLDPATTNVTLDPIRRMVPALTRNLIVSEDRRSVKCEALLEEEEEEICSFLLGCEGFTAGCHFWEVNVGSEAKWAVGVARKLLTGSLILTREEGIRDEEGIWAVGNINQYKAFRKGFYTLLNLSGDLKRIRVSLNYDEGQVAFFDADRAALLCRFSGASFSGETLHPFFAVYGNGCIRLCP